MNTTLHPVIRALPAYGALLLAPLGFSSESGSAYATATSSDAVPAALIVTTAPAGLPAKSVPDRIISPRLTAALAARLPQYVPASRPSAKNETVDRREEANSDGDIYHLPKYVVHGPRPPVFREREMLTQRGLEKLAMKRYITQLDRALNRYRIPVIGIPCEARALAMYAEDDRLQNMADLDRTARNAALVDRAAGAEIKRLADATYQRSRE